ncbi:Oxidoreductase [Dimargaris verticillata]|uniref:Mitochondrial intermembrane space import and assembly protein 40 n=1 Tax=Dimargaris verticillata TaxID=2761393 RepID=A0A9W8EBP3_9FUNG|nr:Oxidoreductase [Dimargaris verticillata]
MAAAEDKDTVLFLTEEEVNAASLFDSEDSSEVSPTSSSLTESPAQAYNPDTGEINWDCPCLGGMATTGPCAEQFRASFSCFVHSEADPKGSDCVGQFMAMQSCFAAHPDVYADLLGEEDPLELEQANEATGPQSGTTGSHFAEKTETTNQME